MMPPPPLGNPETDPSSIVESVSNPAAICGVGVGTVEDPSAAAQPVAVFGLEVREFPGGHAVALATGFLTAFPLPPVQSASVFTEHSAGTLLLRKKLDFARVHTVELVHE